MLREYDRVRVIGLIDATRHYTGTDGVARPPQIGDEGIIVMAYDRDNFAIECVASGGETIWLADFHATELGLAQPADD